MCTVLLITSAKWRSALAAALTALASLRAALAASLTALAAALSRAAWASRSLVMFLYAVCFVLAMMITVRKHVRICIGICIGIPGRNFVHLLKDNSVFGKEDCDHHFP